MSITINPGLTTTAAGSFQRQSNGLVQGVAFPDPSTRFALVGGQLAVTETLPMWGGVGISEFIGAEGQILGAMQNQIKRATLLTGNNALTGFAVFDQAHAMINSPQSPVPLAAAGMGVNYYRLGSGARIAVAIDPSLVSLNGGLVTQAVSWDFNNQRLQPYVASDNSQEVTSITWANTAGGRGTVVMAVPSSLGLGDTINISGATNTGTGGDSAVNGNFVIDTYTDTTHFTIAMPAAAGVIGTIAGTIISNVGVGALACKVLQVDVGNSMIVSYDPTTGFATWNRSGSAAVILI